MLNQCGRRSLGTVAIFPTADGGIKPGTVQPHGSGVAKALYTMCPPGDHWRMTSSPETLTIALEDVGGISWWSGILTILASQYGSTQRRFVGRSDGKTKYRSATFAVPGSVRPVSPEEQWAPGMTAALAELENDLARDGWRQKSRGKEPWSLIYER